MIIQLQFSVVNCREYVQGNMTDIASEISARLLEYVEGFCDCEVNVISNMEHLGCFRKSTLSYRMDLSRIIVQADLPAIEIATLIETWTQQVGTIILDDGYILQFDLSCPTVIPQLNSSECPGGITYRTRFTEAPSQTVNTTSDPLLIIVIGATSGLGALLVVLLILIVFIITVLSISKRRQRPIEFQEPEK